MSDGSTGRPEDEQSPARPGPIDRLRAVGEHRETAPEEPRPEVPDSTDRPQPPPAVIAVGERPGSYAPDGDATAVGDREEKSRKGGSFLRELPILLAVAIVLALLIKTFLVQAFYIPSGSMERTLLVNDKVLVNKLSTHTGSFQRGQVVVFDTSGTNFAKSSNEFVPCPQSNPVVRGARAVERFVGVGTCGQNDYIKRIIAVPGDTVQCCTDGQIVVDGKKLVEPYLYLGDGAPDLPGLPQPSQESMPFCEASEERARLSAGTYESSLCGSDARPITVPAGMYFVLGDHRNMSEDSRYNGFVPRDKIVGRAFVRIWPPSRWGFLRVPGSFKDVGTGVLTSTPLAGGALLVPLVGVRTLQRRRRRR